MSNNNSNDRLSSVQRSNTTTSNNSSPVHPSRQNQDAANTPEHSISLRAVYNFCVPFLPAKKVKKNTTPRNNNATPKLKVQLGRQLKNRVPIGELEFLADDSKVQLRCDSEFHPSASSIDNVGVLLDEMHTHWTRRFKKTLTRTALISKASIGGFAVEWIVQRLLPHSYQEAEAANPGGQLDLIFDELKRLHPNQSTFAVQINASAMKNSAHVEFISLFKLGRQSSVLEVKLHGTSMSAFFPNMRRMLVYVLPRGKGSLQNQHVEFMLNDGSITKLDDLHVNQRAGGRHQRGVPPPPLPQDNKALVEQVKQYYNEAKSLVADDVADVQRNALRQLENAANESRRTSFVLLGAEEAGKSWIVNALLNGDVHDHAKCVVPVIGSKELAENKRSTQYPLRIEHGNKEFAISVVFCSKEIYLKRCAARGDEPEFGENLENYIEGEQDVNENWMLGVGDNERKILMPNTNPSDGFQWSSRSHLTTAEQCLLCLEKLSFSSAADLALDYVVLSTNRCPPEHVYFDTPGTSTKRQRWRLPHVLHEHASVWRDAHGNLTRDPTVQKVLTNVMAKGRKITDNEFNDFVRFGFFNHVRVGEFVVEGWPQVAFVFNRVTINAQDWIRVQRDTVESVFVNHRDDDLNPKADEQLPNSAGDAERTSIELPPVVVCSAGSWVKNVSAFHAVREAKATDTQVDVVKAVRDVFKKIAKHTQRKRVEFAAFSSLSRVLRMLTPLRQRVRIGTRHQKEFKWANVNEDVRAALRSVQTPSEEDSDIVYDRLVTTVLEVMDRNVLVIVDGKAAPPTLEARLERIVERTMAGLDELLTPAAIGEAFRSALEEAATSAGVQHDVLASIFAQAATVLLSLIEIEPCRKQPPIDESLREELLQQLDIVRQQLGVISRSADDEKKQKEENEKEKEKDSVEKQKKDEEDRHRKEEERLRIVKEFCSIASKKGKWMQVTLPDKAEQVVCDQLVKQLAVLNVDQRVENLAKIATDVDWLRIKLNDSLHAIIGTNPILIGDGNAFYPFIDPRVLESTRNTPVVTGEMHLPFECTESLLGKATKFDDKQLTAHVVRVVRSSSDSSDSSQSDDESLRSDVTVPLVCKLVNNIKEDLSKPGSRLLFVVLTGDIEHDFDAICDYFCGAFDRNAADTVAQTVVLVVPREYQAAAQVAVAKHAVQPLNASDDDNEPAFSSFVVLSGDKWNVVCSNERTMMDVSLAFARLVARWRKVDDMCVSLLLWCGAPIFVEWRQVMFVPVQLDRILGRMDELLEHELAKEQRQLDDDAKLVLDVFKLNRGILFDNSEGIKDKCDKHFNNFVEKVSADESIKSHKLLQKLLKKATTSHVSLLVVPQDLSDSASIDFDDDSEENALATPLTSAELAKVDRVSELLNGTADGRSVKLTSLRQSLVAWLEHKPVRACGGLVVTTHARYASNLRSAYQNRPTHRVQNGCALRNHELIHVSLRALAHQTTDHTKKVGGFGAPLGNPAFDDVRFMHTFPERNFWLAIEFEQRYSQYRDILSRRRLSNSENNVDNSVQNNRNDNINDNNNVDDNDNHVSSSNVSSSVNASSSVNVSSSSSSTSVPSLPNASMPNTSRVRKAPDEPQPSERRTRARRASPRTSSNSSNTTASTSRAKRTRSTSNVQK